MFRTTDIVLIAVMVSAAAFTYTTKHQAEAELNKLRRIEAQIRFENETIDLLNADWSLLTQPSRIQRLADTFDAELKLEPVLPYQYADLGDLPPKRLTIEELLDEPLGEMVDGRLDATTTSGVAQ